MDDDREFDHDRVLKINKYRYNTLADNITRYVLNDKIVKLIFSIIIIFITHLKKNIF